MICAIVMAGGRGTRLKVDVEKPLFKLHDKPLIKYVLDNLSSSKLVEDVVIAVSYHTPKTTDYLKSILSKLTWFGALFLSLIAILPMLMRFTSIDISFGGTSILIVVGVALETVQQLESQLVMRHYKGFLEK